MSASVDPEIAAFIAKLNELPFLETLFSCAGYGARGKGFVHPSASNKKEHDRSDLYRAYFMVEFKSWYPEWRGFLKRLRALVHGFGGTVVRMRDYEKAFAVALRPRTEQQLRHRWKLLEAFVDAELVTYNNTQLGALGMRYDDFESFDFETEDGHTVVVMPNPGGRHQVAHFLLEWVQQVNGQPAVRYRWVGDVTPAVLNYAMSPRAGIALEGTQWFFFEDGRHRHSPAVFNLKANMAVWKMVVERLHTAWGLDAPVKRGPSFLNGWRS